MNGQYNVSGLANVYTPEFLNTISGSGLLYHELKLKVGAPLMLLRNIDKSLGLCNGTRLIVVRLCKHVIEAMIISGKFHGERVVIARMVITPSDSRLPFRFQRRQFPIVLSFAMTINKSQGQTLSNVALALRLGLHIAIDCGVHRLEVETAYHLLMFS
ncbi:ATP-dependent DNA helicase PIF1-like [Senna tora]|uniref:ATP-dependent DNA helicase PIF1-like n=1 Tax=Senna tora TaxID=362788 RepID=A0A834W0M4_9FABA|nr:ATP-dependent DNA helicase PIF1-like [Senna tora]